MMNRALANLNRDGLLRRLAILRAHISVAALRALTEGREPEELSDESLRSVIAAIERGLPAADG
jgi:hypothetical protein